MGGITDSTGRLQFCARGFWGSVCDYYEYWGSQNAQVVCNQLGFSTEGNCCLITIDIKVLLNTAAHTLHFDTRFGVSAKDPVIGEVNCAGTETELLKCSHSSIGNHHCTSGKEFEVIVSCYGAFMNRQCDGHNAWPYFQNYSRRINYMYPWGC